MMRALGMILPSLFLLAATTWGAFPASAQLDSGARVRVTSARGKQIGTLVSLDGDSLRYTLVDSATVTAIPRASVVRLERSVGKRSNVGSGAKTMGLIGAGVGLTIGLLAAADNSGWFEIGVEEIAAVTAVFGATGAGVGALFGAASKHDLWEAVPLSPGVPK
jgi:hypothetical protein